MADIELPLWSIPPNWSTPVSERLIFMTDVLASKSGAEQRRKLRLSPRREFEFKINPQDEVRSYFDQWMHRINDERILLPLWHDKSKLAVFADDGDTRLEFDTRWTEFEEGGLAVLWADPFTHELVEIDAIDDNGIDLTTALAADWPEGSIVYPIRRCWMDTDLTLKSMTSRVGESTVVFQVDGTNDIVEGAEVLTIYAGYPVITKELNRRDDLEVQYQRILEEMDGQFGKRRRFDEVGRSFQSQFYNWTAYGRQEHAELRQTIYRLAGRQKAFWLPSFNRDVVLARDLDTGSNRLSINKIGYTLLGGAIAGRNRILIQDDNGDYQILAIDGTSAALGPGEERLNLSTNSTFDAAAGRYGMFMDTMRLENDDIEIIHHTDSHGVCEVAVACKSFSDTRNAVAPFLAPRPEAVMDSNPCGDAAPPAATPYLRFRLEFLGPAPGHDGRIGEPGLGFWLYANNVNHGLHGPNEEFICKVYAQWAELLDPDVYPADDPDVEQFIECRIQGGTGTAGCPSEGDRVESIRLWVHRPGWINWRAALAWPAGSGNFFTQPNPSTGIGAFESGGFPGTMYFRYLPDEGNAAWATVTMPFVEP